LIAGVFVFEGGVRPLLGGNGRVGGNGGVARVMMNDELMEMLILGCYYEHGSPTRPKNG
jgi:hypothetical protein